MASPSWGRKEIAMAEREMPGLMDPREKYGHRSRVRAPIAGSLHMTIQTAVLIETLKASGPKSAGPLQQVFYPGPCRRGPCRQGHSDFRNQGREPEGILGLHGKTLEWPDGGAPNMILDYGGDTTS